MKKVSVFPKPVAAEQTIFFWPSRKARQTFICRRHGLLPNFSSVSARMAANVGMTRDDDIRGEAQEVGTGESCAAVLANERRR